MRPGSTKLGQDMAIIRLISARFPDFPCGFSLSPAYDCLARGPELHMGGNVGSWIGGWRRGWSGTLPCGCWFWFQNLLALSPWTTHSPSLPVILIYQTGAQIIPGPQVVTGFRWDNIWKALMPDSQSCYTVEQEPLVTCGYLNVIQIN